LFALAIHHLSPRREETVCCAELRAIPEGLVENELFGHERGASGAGARKSQDGHGAPGKRCFWMKLANWPLRIQAKLLRVLEERRFERWEGHSRSTWTFESWWRQTGIAEANAREKWSRGFVFSDFRSANDDSALRERGTTCCCWRNTFWGKIKREFGKPPGALARAKERLLHYRWPGNVVNCRTRWSAR